MRFIIFCSNGKSAVFQLQIIHYYHESQYLEIQIMIIFPNVRKYQVPLFSEIFYGIHHSRLQQITSPFPQKTVHCISLEAAILILVFLAVVILQLTSKHGFNILKCILLLPFTERLFVGSLQHCL